MELAALTEAFNLGILRHNTHASLRAMDDDAFPLDPVRYRYLLDLRNTAKELLAGAEAEAHLPIQDRDSLLRIRHLVAYIDDTIAQIARTIPHHPLPQ